LIALMAVLRVTGAQVADAAGLSQAMVSKVLNGRSSVNPATLYEKLEANLVLLMASRSAPYFELSGADVVAVQEAVDSVRAISR
jgi:transcriptional regulator with XRE-family HTH domain